ncbi:MAG: polysaccharide deacetylase family protein [bacterium]|nr:polysaccharide deacetylase family protein [bacterium]
MQPFKIEDGEPGSDPGSAIIRDDTRKFKLLFLLLCAIIIGSMALGIEAFRGKSGGILRMLNMQTAYVMHALAYARQNGQSNESGGSAVKTAPRPDENIAYAVPVITYHGITDHVDPDTTTNVTEEAFVAQMFALKEAGYRAISIAELHAFLKGQAPLPERSFMITFDDGRADAYVRGDPVLRAVGYHAVMFVISSNSLDAPGTFYLTADDLKQMQQSGRWDIQPHAHDGHAFYPISESGALGHFYANKFWLANDGRYETDAEYEARVTRDIDVVASRLEAVFGTKMTAFDLPFGDFGQYTTNYPEASRIMERVLRQRFPLIFYQDAPGVYFTQNYVTAFDAKQKSFFVKRINVDPSWDGEALIKILERSSPKSLPYDDDFQRDNGWIVAWGMTTIAPGQMTINPNPTQGGGSVILDGSRHWKDYAVKARIVSLSRSGTFLWVRMQNNGFNAGCNYGNGFVHVEQVVNGEKNVLRGIRSPDIVIPSDEFTVEARVHGRTLSCYLDGVLMVETPFLDPLLDSGGIGFKTWEPFVGISEIIVKEVHVEAISS